MFGLDNPEPAIAKIRCPLFVCYGTNEPDIGTAADLELIKRNARASSRIHCRIFEGADHSYAGHEEELAEAILAWVNELAPSG